MELEVNVSISSVFYLLLYRFIELEFNGSYIFLGIRTNRGEVLQFIRLIIGIKSKLYIYIIKLWNEIQLYGNINIKLEWNPSFVGGRYDD